MTKKRICWWLSAAASLAGLGFIFSGTIFDLLHPLIFDAAGECRTDGIFRSLSPVLLHLQLRFMADWCYWGVPLFFLGLAGVIITQTVPPTIAGFVDRNRFGLAALVVALAANTFAFVSSVGFFFVPTGSHIQPMGWAMMMFVITVSTPAVVVPVGIIATVRETQSVLGSMGMLLSFAPYAVGRLMLEAASRLNGFTLAN